MTSTTHQTRKAPYFCLTIHYAGPKPPKNSEINNAIRDKWGMAYTFQMNPNYARAIKNGWGDNIVMSWSEARGGWQIDEVYMTPKK